ncbi:MAG: GntR family transcriptional regulator, partial [Olsenella sp.]
GCLSVNGVPGLTADFGEGRLRTEAKSIELIGATGDLAKRMKCAEGTEVYQLLRLRYVDEKPFDLEYSWYLKSIVRYMNREIAEGSIYRYLREDVGITIAFSDKIMRTEKLGAFDAELLGLPEGDPALIVEDDAYTSNCQLFNASKNLYDWTRAKFFTLSQIK